jgi:hypothetical protein
MTLYHQLIAGNARPRWPVTAKARVSCAGPLAGAVRTLSATAADALYTYAVTGSAFATIVVLAGPHLDFLLRCVAHGKG